MNLNSDQITTFLLEQPGLKKSDTIPGFPNISIITPSYNQSVFLEQTILSVLNQNYPNLEYIIIDGGSTDNSKKIIKKYSQYISYWVSEKDNGQTHAINKGLQKATGDLIAYQNSDDLYLPGAFFSIASAWMKDKKKHGIYYGNLIHINQNNTILDEHLLMKSNYWLELFKGPLIHNQSAFWTKNVVENIGLFDESFQFCMDFDYFNKILQGGYKVKFIAQHLGAFRRHDDAKSSRLIDLSIKEHKKVFDKYRDNHIFTKFFPKKAGSFIGTVLKSLSIVFSGRLDYLLRKRYIDNE